MCVDMPSLLNVQGTKLRSLIRLLHWLLTSFFRLPLIFSSSHYVIALYTYFPFDLVALLAPCFVKLLPCLGYVCARCAALALT